MKSSKNPIALLNEFCSKEKKNLDFKIEADVVTQNGSNSTKKSIFYTTCLVEGFGIVVNKEAGDSKQASKTNSALKAVYELITHYESTRLQLLVMLKRIMGVIPKDFKKAENKKPRKERKNNSLTDSQECLLTKDLLPDPNAYLNANNTEEIQNEIELPKVETDTNQVQQIMSFFTIEGEQMLMSEKFPSETNTSSKISGDLNHQMQIDNSIPTAKLAAMTGVQQISMIPDFSSIQELMDDESKI